MEFEDLLCLIMGLILLVLAVGLICASGGDDKAPIDCYFEEDTVEKCYDCCRDIESRVGWKKYGTGTCFNKCSLLGEKQ